MYLRDLTAYPRRKYDTASRVLCHIAIVLYNAEQLCVPADASSLRYSSTGARQLAGLHIHARNVRAKTV